MAGTGPAPEGHKPLVEHFEDKSAGSHNAVWSNLWDIGQTLWDRGKPSPALIDIVEQRQDLFAPLRPDGSRKRALVPGCGRGYDVVMLALHGFDTYGLDVSETGISAARDNANKEIQSPGENNFGSNWKGSQGTGAVNFLQADFFAHEENERQYDLIYDYTFLCALHPTMRAQWAARMSQLLAPGGTLICLEFPLYKEPNEPGPPWPLKGVHWDILARGGDGINFDDQDKSSDGNFRRLFHLKPERSYESGRGTDMISAWELK